MLAEAEDFHDSLCPKNQGMGVGTKKKHRTGERRAVPLEILFIAFKSGSLFTPSGGRLAAKQLPNTPHPPDESRHGAYGKECIAADR